MYAAENGNTTVATILLNHNADLEAQDEVVFQLKLAIHHPDSILTCVQCHYLLLWIRSTYLYDDLSDVAWMRETRQGHLWQEWCGIVVSSYCDSYKKNYNCACRNFLFRCLQAIRNAPLIIAVQQSQVQIIKIFLKAKASLDVFDEVAVTQELLDYFWPAWCDAAKSICS